MISRLHHVNITIPVGAEAEGRRFYCDLLGLKEIPKPSTLQERGGFWLQLGDLQIHISVEDGIDRWAMRAHLAYEVDNLNTWRSRLLAHQIEIKESLPFSGYVRFECRDPFGNRIEFIQPVIE